MIVTMSAVKNGELYFDGEPIPGPTRGVGRTASMQLCRGRIKSIADLVQSDQLVHSPWKTMQHSPRRPSRHNKALVLAAAVATNVPAPVDNEESEDTSTLSKELVRDVQTCSCSPPSFTPRCRLLSLYPRPDPTAMAARACADKVRSRWDV